MSEQETPVVSSPTESAVASSRWVRLCRWLWRGLRFVCGMLVVVIVVGTIANLNTTTTDTPLSKLYLIHVAMTYPLPTIASIGILVLLTILSWTGSKEHPVTTPLSPSQKNRLHFLHRLRFIYDQMMTDSLQNAAWLELGLASKPDAVQNVSTLLLRTPTQPERLLPAGTSIVEVYEQAHHELLILGEPGTGKSTLLVRLAQHLVEQAVQDETHPLPIILPLSSWAVKHLPLQQWLGEQISLMYDVPRRFSQHWVQEERLLLLLDGLDEMDEGARTACIAAINTFHHDRLYPLVVCSRTEEYDDAAASERLVLQQAVIVQALTPAQVDAYLVQASRPLAALRAALRKNPTLAALATTSLMLHVLMLTYQGTSVRELSHKEAQLSEQIWADYVQRMVSRKGDVKRYPLHDTITWLSFLARQMRQRDQTIFYLEQLQPDWLPKRQRAFYRWSVGLVFGLVFGLVVGLGGGLIYGLLGGLVGGLFFGLFFRPTKIEPVEALTWSWKKTRSGLLGWLLGWLSFGLLGWPAFGLLGGLLFGLFVGLFVGLYFVQSSRRLTERLTLSLNEGIQRSVKNGLLILFIGMVGGLVLRLVLGLVFGLFVGLFVGLGSGLAAAVKHYILRFWLSCTHTFPWKAVPFLEDATTRILLRRVGGGYSFSHRLLLDHFADLNAEPMLVSATPPSANTA